MEWPAVALDGRSTIDVCVAAPNPFGSDLEGLLAGEQLNQRQFLLRRVATATDVDGCHVLFLPAHPAGPHPLLAVAASRPVLTVSDAPRFLDHGGIVAIRVVSGRLRFDIDAAAARRVGLRISSQLLGLAVSVRGRLS